MKTLADIRARAEHSGQIAKAYMRAQSAIGLLKPDADAQALENAEALLRLAADGIAMLRRQTIKAELERARS